MTTKQTPIGTGYGASSTAEDVIRGINLSGKIAIVTGGYSGLGLETVRVLRSAGAKVIVPTRDRNKAAAALADIDGIEIEGMDLLDPASIDAFAEKFLASGQPLHILVNSAGIMASPLTRDSRGYESQFATNHLGHFQLVARLWPALCKANGARVVSVSSWGHHFSPVVFDDPNYERRNYDRWGAYGQAKTANILFALELDKRGHADGVRAFSLHPGSIVGTGLEKHLSNEELRAAGVIDENGQPVLDPTKNLKTVGQGAATSVWCATSPQLNNRGGIYCENCDIAPLGQDAESEFHLDNNSTLTDSGVMPYAVDPDAAERLWRLSEQLIGLTFAI
ncbi:NAD(P)-dependent dehydrogenase (short-subunit alcohol dehydrogenase family) [Paenibacillus endophyticus]|uniref:Probable oxidoreductase n=1 Tax=Paenibacillus endophyticus TaxID=1294268 RepID=A0A7W5GB62_9BACL|nr:oxidoreductase [Paenibacillus endophyticus]MBB3153038.1 NAD(P)-dependent dehydrogenase (short-subunit alcohol dehydrogenase family) [Paenibacillus endophyticus]